jgi:hypothetical protein
MEMSNDKKDSILSHIPQELREDLKLQQQARAESQAPKEEPAPQAAEEAITIPDDYNHDVQSEEAPEEETQSGSFAEFVKEQEPVQMPTSTDSDILSMFKVDLNHIEVTSEKTEFERQKDLDLIFKSRKAMQQVTAVQSSYNAFLSALSMQDINLITNSNLSVYDSRRVLYRVIHSLIQDTSLGKIGFTDWLKITSYHDLDTLLYAVYCQTFPESNKFDVTCPSCGKQTGVVVNNNTLVKTYNPGLVMDKIKEVIKNVHNVDEILSKSLVHTKERAMLPESKVILEIQTPSLFDHLELLRTVNPQILENQPDTVGTILFIKSAYVPDLVASRNTGSPKFYSVTDRNALMEIVTKVGIEDGKAMNRAINARIKNYAVEYTIKNVKCSHCKDALGEIDLDMETLLFFQIAREAMAE